MTRFVRLDASGRFRFRSVVVAAALAALGACSGRPASRQSAEDVKSGLLRRMPSTSTLLFISVSGEGNGQVTTPDVTLNWLSDDVFERSDVSGAYWAYAAQGTTIHLTATASGPSTFTGWFGTCTGTGACDVTMGENVDVAVVFDSTLGGDPTRAQLTAVTAGHGGGAVTGAGINCVSGSRIGCSVIFDVTRPPQTATLHAQADDSSIFRGWSGSCGGTGDCTVSMDSARAAYATFAPKILTVRVRTDGAGRVLGPNGFSCSSASGCDLTIPNDSPAPQIVLTADPVATFIVWSGDCSASTWDTTCTLTVNDHKNVFASWGPLSNHVAALGSGDVMVFEQGNGDHGAGFTMTENCTTCHFANLVTQHGRQCALCHAGKRPADLVTGIWNKGCSQAACHATVHAGGLGSDHFMMWQDTSAACARCHDTNTGDFPGPGDNCTRCHDPSLTAGAVGDHQPPTTTSDAQGAYVGGGTIHLTATDAGSAGVSVTWFSLDGHRWELGTEAGFGAPLVGSRAHTLQFYSVDHALNAESVKTVAFTAQALPDTTPPITTSNPNPSAGAIYPSALVVTLSASDDASGVKATYYRIDAGAFVQGTSFTVSGSGLHTFSFYSVDNAGNAETVHVSSSFGIGAADTTPPVTTSTAVNGATYTGDQVFTLLATDSGSGVAGTWSSLDGAAFVPGTSIAVAAPASGSVSHALSWYSRDFAGNQETTRSVTFSVQAGAVTSGTVTLSFRTNASFGGWSYVTWEVHDAAGNVVNDVDGFPCTWWNDDPGHPASMGHDYVVPANVAYTMYGAWGPMEDGPDVDTGTRDVTPAEAAPGATITWWWY